MATNMQITRKRRGDRRSTSSKIRKEINQERLLLGVAELLRHEMELQSKSIEQMEQALEVNQAYIQSLLHGFANITLRELADVFSALNKRVLLTSTGQNEAASQIEQRLEVESPFSKVEVLWTLRKSEQLFKATYHIDKPKIEDVRPPKKREMVFVDNDWAGELLFTTVEKNGLETQ